MVGYVFSTVSGAHNTGFLEGWPDCYNSVDYSYDVDDLM